MAKTMLNSGVLFTDRRVFYLDPQMTSELYPEVAPFTTLLSSMGSVKVPDPDFKMFEHRSPFIKQQMSVNYGSGYSWSSTGAAGDTIAAVAIDGIVGLASSVDNSYEGLVLEIWDSTLATFKGICLVTDAVSSSTVKLKSLGNPNASTNLASALVDDDVLAVVGTAFGEGTNAPEAWADELSVIYNSTQIFKTSVDITGTLYEAALRGYSSELARLRDEKMKEHKIQKERAFLFGTRPAGTGSILLSTGAVSGSDAHATHQTDEASKTVRTTMGIISALRRYGTTSGASQNIFSINSASYTYPDFVDDMEKVFQYVPTSGRKIAFVGAGALGFWSKLSGTFLGTQAAFNVEMGPSRVGSLGFNVRELVTPHGVLDIVWAPVLRNQYNNYMVVVDPEHVKHVQYRPMKFETNIKTDDGYDGVKDLIQSDEGLGISLIETHSLWTIS